jgi:sodium-dependent phosphate cotransporter
MTIALVHTLFNLTAIVVIFPVSRLRMIPVRMAERLATVAVRRRGAVVAYVLGVFLLLPVLGMLLLQ